MRKYIQVMKMNIEITLTYKWNLILTSLMDIFRIVAEIAFWKINLQQHQGIQLVGIPLIQ